MNAFTHRPKARIGIPPLATAKHITHNGCVCIVKNVVDEFDLTGCEEDRGNTIIFADVVESNGTTPVGSTLIIA